MDDVITSDVVPALDVKGAGIIETGSIILETVTFSGAQPIQVSEATAQKLILAAQQAPARLSESRSNIAPQLLAGLGTNLYQATMLTVAVSDDGQNAIISGSGPDGPPVNIAIDARGLRQLQTECKQAALLASRRRTQTAN